MKKLCVQVCAVLLCGVLSASVLRAQALFPPLLGVEDLNGENGVRFQGTLLGDLTGLSVAGIGDFNHDGIDDFAIGVLNDDEQSPHAPGLVYIVFGAPGVRGAADYALPLLDGSNGFEVRGVNTHDYVGFAIDAAGDFNDDGIDDVIIGSPGSGDQSGEVHILFGSEQATFPHPFSVDDIDGQNGVTLRGDGQRLGHDVAGLGDVNGDGIDDVVIGDPAFGTNTGQALVVLGRSGPFNATQDLEQSTGVLRVQGDLGNIRLGYSVDGAGDANCDGQRDVLIGIKDLATSEPNSNGTGAALLLFGHAGLTDQSPLLLSQVQANMGALLWGQDALDYTGFSVAGVGDVNVDGCDDVLIGAPGYSPPPFLTNAGIAYLLFGSVELNGDVQMGQIGESEGVHFPGLRPNAHSGAHVSAAGDVNGDGAADVVIGSHNLNPGIQTSANRSFIVFGRHAFSATGPFDLNALDGYNGLAMHGLNPNSFDTTQDMFGQGLAAAGDVDGDGVDDVLIGAPLALDADATQVGSAYAVFGRDEDVIYVAGFDL